VVEAAPQKPAAAAEAPTPPKATGRRATPEEAYLRARVFDRAAAAWYVRGISLDNQTTAFDIIHAVCGEVPKGRGIRRQLTGLVAKLDGLEPVIPATKGNHPTCARRETPWGPSNLYKRVPLLTERRA
jgi:hypothetical protein